MCPFWQQLVLLNIFRLKLLHEEEVGTGITISYHPALCVQGAWGAGRKARGEIQDSKQRIPPLLAPLTISPTTLPAGLTGPFCGFPPIPALSYFTGILQQVQSAWKLVSWFLSSVRNFLGSQDGVVFTQVPQ